MTKQETVVEFFGQEPQGTVNISVDEYALLVDHDTRISIIREALKSQIDEHVSYPSLKSEFLLHVLDLGDYQKMARKKQQEEHTKPREEKPNE